MLGPISLDAIIGLPDQLLKSEMIVFMVYSRHIEFLLTYRCS